MKTFPNTPDDLIAEIARLFPERVPEPSQTLDTIMYHAGQRSVVKFLQQWRAHPSLGLPEVPQRGQGRPTR